MVTLSPSTLARFEDMLRPPRRGGALGRGRKSQAIRGQDYELKIALGKGSAAERSGKALKAFERISKKVPEVVVRRTGKQSSGSHALANFTYIARLGHAEGKELELTTSDGRVIKTGQEMRDLAQEWGHWHEEDKARRKGPVSYSIVFSMPAGTDGNAVKEATIAVAQRECPDQGWVVALHNDTDHVHAHLTVQARDQHGDRQFFPRARMTLMREMFAEELRGRGIEANATSRRSRGVYDKQEPIQAVKQRERNGSSQRERNLKDQLKTDWKREPTQDPIDQRMRNAKTSVVEVYKDVARELLVSDSAADKKLGMAVAQHLQDMPAPHNRYSEARAAVQQAIEKQQGKTVDKDVGRAL